MRMISGFVSLMQSSFSPPAWASIIAGFFVLVVLALSSFLLFEHLSAYNNPEEQKFLIGVVLMVPCYSVESYVSLVNPSLSVDCGILRDCYEAFAMYCFGRYFVACLGGEERTVEFMEREGASSANTPLLGHVSEKGVIHHHFPMNYFLKPWRVGNWFYQVIKFGIFQYMIIKTITAILSVIFESFGVYCEGEFKLRCGYPYMAAVLNFSQYWALYCLVQFYTAIKDELAYIKPLAKFLVFKSIVFLTWWQGVTIALLYTLGLLKSPIAQGLQLRSSIQDFFICIEMAIASIVHLYVFPAKPYELLGGQLPRNVSVLGDYASADCPVDPDEVKECTRPTKLRLPQPDTSVKAATNIKESVRDIVVGGGGHIVNDFKFTVNRAVEPVEKTITKFNEKLHRISQNIKKDRRKSRDDSSILSQPRREILGIDDPLLNGASSDSGATRGRRHQKKLVSANESAGDSSEQPPGVFKIQGHRWVIKD
ncbi:protein LAZ1-like isoform X1 [Zingiber officinale]|uniref:protein LAZ1-like isoform X1 n=1 Tax=Zingiber officinale TaxID=94328 RepID=UPI001C4D9C41|nr:protein LAZ1-like isoform X1 [Zingiber officinale]